MVGGAPSGLEGYRRLEPSAFALGCVVSPLWGSYRRRVPIAFLAPFLLLLLLTGCASTRPFLGKWTGMQKIAGQPGADPDILNSVAKVVVEVRDGGRFDLRLDTFDLSGTVSMDGEKAVLTPDTLMNRPLDRQPPETRDLAKTAILSFNADGTLKFQMVGRDPVTLRRQPG